MIELAELVGRLRQVGVATLASEPHPAQGEWAGVDSLSGDAMGAAIDAYAAAVGTTDRPLAAALFAKELAGKVNVPTVATWALTSAELDIRPANVYISIVGGRPQVCALENGGVSAPVSVSRLAETLVAFNERVFAAVRAEVRIAHRLFWGNVASHVSSATAASFPLAGAAAWQARTAIATALPQIAGLVVDTPSVDDNGQRCPIGIRTTCCLRYRLNGMNECGACNRHDRAEQVPRLAAYWRQRWSNTPR